MPRTVRIGGFRIPFDDGEFDIPALNDEPVRGILRDGPTNLAAVFPDGCHRWFHILTKAGKCENSRVGRDSPRTV